MNDTNQKIELYFSNGLDFNYCTFNLRNQFILYGHVYKHVYKHGIEKLDGYIWIYNTKDTENVLATKNEKLIWKCENIYEIPKKFELVSISKDDKLYLLSDNSIYEWHIVSGRIVGSIFANEEHTVNKILLKLFI